MEVEFQNQLPIITLTPPLAAACCENVVIEDIVLFPDVVSDKESCLSSEGKVHCNQSKLITHNIDKSGDHEIAHDDVTADKDTTIKRNHTAIQAATNSGTVSQQKNGVIREQRKTEENKDIIIILNSSPTVTSFLAPPIIAREQIINVFYPRNSSRQPPSLIARIRPSNEGSLPLTSSSAGALLQEKLTTTKTKTGSEQHVTGNSLDEDVDDILRHIGDVNQLQFGVFLQTMSSWLAVEEKILSNLLDLRQRVVNISNRYATSRLNLEDLSFGEAVAVSNRSINELLADCLRRMNDKLSDTSACRHRLLNDVHATFKALEQAVSKAAINTLASERHDIGQQPDSSSVGDVSTFLLSPNDIWQ